jgi:hypothetical protein
MPVPVTVTVASCKSPRSRAFDSLTLINEPYSTLSELLSMIELLQPVKTSANNAKIPKSLFIFFITISRID